MSARLVITPKGEFDFDASKGFQVGARPGTAFGPQGIRVEVANGDLVIRVNRTNPPHLDLRELPSGGINLHVYDARTGDDEEGEEEMAAPI